MSGFQTREDHGRVPWGCSLCWIVSSRYCKWDPQEPTCPHDLQVNKSEPAWVYRFYLSKMQRPTISLKLGPYARGFALWNFALWLPREFLFLRNLKHKSHWIGKALTSSWRSRMWRFRTLLSPNTFIQYGQVKPESSSTIIFVLCDTETDDWPACS